MPSGIGGGNIQMMPKADVQQLHIGLWRFGFKAD